MSDQFRAETTTKIERITRLLRTENLGGALLNTQSNFAWATAGGDNGIDRSRENGAASILIRRDGKRYVLASRIEMPRILAEEISAEDYEPIEFSWEEERATPDFTGKLAARLLADGETLGADVALGANVKTIENQIAKCRYELTTGEIERYRALGADAGEAIGELARTVQPGASENEIARRAADALAAKNIRSVVLLVAADERLSRFRHPLPTEKAWEKVLMIVVGARRGGLTASLSRIVCAGSVPADLRRKTEALARINAALWAATKPGATGAELYRIAADAYAAEDCAGEINLHHQGGACGYRTRDWTAHPANSETVHANQAFAWNPTITGAKTEETVVAFEDKIEVLTASPGWTQIAAEAGEREYLMPGVWAL